MDISHAGMSSVTRRAASPLIRLISGSNTLWLCSDACVEQVPVNLLAVDSP